MSMEFVLITAFVFLIVFIISLFVLSEIKSIQAEKESMLVQDLALKLQEEISLASVVEDGYLRNFSIPATLEYLNYSIMQQNQSITVESKKGIFIVGMPKVNGNITKGNNIIRKEGGVIYINQ